MVSEHWLSVCTSKGRGGAVRGGKGGGGGGGGEGEGREGTPGLGLHPLKLNPR